MRSRGWIAALLVAATVVVYLPVRHHEFLSYDDGKYITKNPNLESPFGWESIVRDLTTPYEANWIPLTWISLHADRVLYGYEPAGFLLTNVALHALSAVLLFLALARMTGSLRPSLFVAAVFALHPLHVESVAWASERKDALSGVFWMLGLYAHARHAERPESVARYTAVLLCLALGLLAKPMLVTFPFALLLLDAWPLRRFGRRAVLEKVPMLVLSFGASVVAFLVQQSVGSVADLVSLSPGVRIANAVVSYVVYLRQSLWPVGLAAFYPLSLDGIPAATVAASAALLASITAAVLWLRRPRPYLAVGWFWYLGTLVPVIGIVQVGLQAHADRYTYIPLVGLSIMVAWGARDIAVGNRARAIGFTALGVLSAVAMLALARSQIGYWRDSRALWERAIAVVPDNFLAEEGLGNALYEDERFEEARQRFETSIRIEPRRPDSFLRLGDTLRRQGDLEGAVEAYRDGLARDAAHLGGNAALGIVLVSLERFDEARPQLELSALGDPSPQVLVALGDVLVAQGDFDGAARRYERAVAMDPELDRARVAHALALLRAGQADAARRLLDAELAAGRESAELYAGLALAAIVQGRQEVAIRHSRDALRLDPTLASAVNNLAWILATTSDASLRDPRESLRLSEGVLRKTGRPAANLLDTVAAGYAATGRFEDAARMAARAAEAAEAQGGAQLGKEIRGRLALYQTGRPYIEATSASGG